jgi:regulator of protease activity HflC (stomatin/prohibitin superfamily)
MITISTIVVIAILVVLIFSSSVRIFREYERGVMFTLGRYTSTRGPGIVLMVPLIQQIVRVDLRIVVSEVPPQDVISRDNVSVKVSAVIYYRVVDAERAVIQVRDYMEATSQLSQTTLRSVLGKHDLDEMLAERDKLNTDIQEVLDKQTDSWGIKVSNVEIKRIDLDESMVRAIARQAEAERSRRAKVINALGEEQAAQKLLDAARILAPVPQAMQLRYLATLFDIAGERTSTIVFPFPIDLMQALSARLPTAGSEGA